MRQRSGASEGLALLGLAQRAGAVARGTDATRRAIERGEARLVVLAEDASPAQLEKILKSMARRSLPRGYVPSRAELGAALGAGPLSAVAVTKALLAARIARVLEAADPRTAESKSE